MFSVTLRPQRPYGLLGTGNPGRPPLSSTVLSYGDHKDCKGRGAQGGHFDFHTALSELCWGQFMFSVTLRPQRPYGLLGTGSSGRPPLSPWVMLQAVHVQCYFTSTETIRTIRDGEPRTATSTFTQLLNSLAGNSSSVLLYIHRDRKDY